jgi:antitoxin ParD1/3/4
LTLKDFAMQTMNISLPDPMKQYVEEQVTAGDYSSASEYMRELVRADQQRNARERLEQGLLESLLEGEAQEATPEFWSTLRAELGKRARPGRGARQTSKVA